MGYILDTNALIFYLYNPERLSKAALDIVYNENNQTYSYQIVYTSYLDIIESLVTIASFSEIACEIISLSNGSP